MLDTFGMQQGGSQYRRLVAAIQRIFGATILFGTDTQTQTALVTRQARFNFMPEAHIRFSRDPNLSDEFFREVMAHSRPTDLEAAKAHSCAPAALALFMWLSYRCFTAKGQERIPIFGECGLAAHLQDTNAA